MKINKFLLVFFIFFISLPVFIWLESGFFIKTINDIIKPLIFSTSLVISIANFYRNYLLRISFTLLFLMVIFYLFWQIPASEWFGSVGLGILTVYVLGHIPQLIKKGYIEKI